MKLLAIESSCDETAAAVVENGRTVLSSVVLKLKSISCMAELFRKLPPGDIVRQLLALQNKHWHKLMSH